MEAEGEEPGSEDLQQVYPMKTRQLDQAICPTTMCFVLYVGRLHWDMKHPLTREGWTLIFEVEGLSPAGLPPENSHKMLM